LELILRRNLCSEQLSRSRGGVVDFHALLKQHEGPYKIISMINPALYDAEVNGKVTRVHALYMNPV
jgi:hypothetical protein